ELCEPLIDQAMNRRGARISSESAAFAAVVVTAPRITVATPAPSFRVAGRPLSGERLRAAAIASDRHSIVAVGVHGLYRFARGVWSAMHLPAGVDARFLRGLLRGPQGELVLFGDGGFAMVVSRAGLVDRLPI